MRMQIWIGYYNKSLIICATDTARHDLVVFVYWEFIETLSVQARSVVRDEPRPVAATEGTISVQETSNAFSNLVKTVHPLEFWLCMSVCTRTCHVPQNAMPRLSEWQSVPSA